jgi:ribonuclease BN (tRNA processing enzyme)
VLTLTVLGCDGSHAGPGGLDPQRAGVGAGAGSGYLVRWWPTRTAVWVDAGPGTFAALQRAMAPDGLSAIVLSHRHRDHTSDLAGFAEQARWSHRPGEPPVPVLAPAEVVAELRHLGGGALAWTAVADGAETLVGPLRLRFARTDHEPETLALRLEAPGRRLGYSADTGPGWSASALGRDLDLLLCEATYSAAEERIGVHLSGRQAGRMARAAGARRLVITHRWAALPAAAVRREAEEAFGGPVGQAVPGRGYSL